MPNFDAAFEGEYALAVGCGVAFSDFGDFHVFVDGEVSAAYQANDVSLACVGAGDP